MTDSEFIAQVWQAGHDFARPDLLWRTTRDPYAIWVSEVMLQQTQVARVLKYWPRWMAAFPTPDALAAATIGDVLELWQGLGYNRRALALKHAAETCASTWQGRVPQTQADLLALPGIGPATAAGILAFAYNKPGVYLETNVRTVYLHAYFPQAEAVHDKELIPIIARTCSQDNPRAWYYALLDWGAHLKATLPNPSRKSAHHTRQSAFEGSRRQKRAYIVREVVASPGISLDDLKQLLDEHECTAGRLPLEAEVFNAIVGDLVAEGFFTQQDNCLIP